MKRWGLLVLVWVVVGLAKAESLTLLAMAGGGPVPARLGESVLVIIDAQREYVDGALPLAGVGPAVNEIAALLARARRLGVPVVHVVHRGRPGGALFDPRRAYVSVVSPLTPFPDERVIEKQWPDAFADTGLESALVATGRKELVVVGFMTHMCVSSTVRAALARGYRTSVVAAATATRDLPDGEGGIVPAATLQRASLAALADRFAAVVGRAEALAD